MEICLITIDPGKSNGGIAFKDTTGKVGVIKMPQTIQEIQDFFLELDKTQNCEAIIEQLHAGSVVQGPKKSAKTIWSQAENYTALMCALYSANIPVKEVSPVKWMGKITGHGARPKDYGDRKKWLKSYAIKRFPSLKVTDYASDALCIMDVSRELL